jgi:exopolysaccharide biosynthesis polyprenyl glycosylphosphotransferase
MAIYDTAFPETDDVVTEKIKAFDWLSLRFSERKLLLAFADTFLLLLALVVTLIIRSGRQVSWQSFPPRWVWLVSLVTIWFLCALPLECYNLSYAASIPSSLKRISAAVFLATGLYMFIPYITPTLPTSRLIVFAFPLLSLVGIAAWRIIYATVFVRLGFQQRALIVGVGRTGPILIQAMAEMSHGNGKFDRDIGYQILGLVDDDAATQSLTLDNLRVLGTTHELVHLVQRLHADELIVADELISAITTSNSLPGQPRRRRSDSIHTDLFDAILECRERGVSITTEAMVYEHFTGRVPLQYVSRALNVALPLDQSATHRFYLVLQYMFDIGISLIGCLLLIAAIPLVWLANYFTSPGPIFYRQERVGRGGQTFYLLKFRSMVVDAEKHMGTVWAGENDRRITPAGRFLRKTRLDEIPQFWNILRGEMSLIGPRPERPYFVQQLGQHIPFYRARHAVKPGLTGWAQVNYRYGASVEDAIIKLQYDLYYIKHQGVFLDLAILLKTIPVVLGFKGR